MADLFKRPAAPPAPAPQPPTEVSAPSAPEPEPPAPSPSPPPPEHDLTPSDTSALGGAPTAAPTSNGSAWGKAPASGPTSAAVGSAVGSGVGTSLLSGLSAAPGAPTSEPSPLAPAPTPPSTSSLLPPASAPAVSSASEGLGLQFGQFGLGAGQYDSQYSQFGPSATGGSGGLPDSLAPPKPAATDATAGAWNVTVGFGFPFSDARNHSCSQYFCAGWAKFSVL